jgi:hypothetical protein
MINRNSIKDFDILIRITLKPRITRFENAMVKRFSLKDLVFLRLYLPVKAEMSSQMPRK